MVPLTPTCHQQTGICSFFRIPTLVSMALFVFAPVTEFSFPFSLTGQPFPTFKIQIQSHLLYQGFPDFPLALANLFSVLSQNLAIPPLYSDFFLTYFPPSWTTGPLNKDHGLSSAASIILGSGATECLLVSEFPQTAEEDKPRLKHCSPTY